MRALTLDRRHWTRLERNALDQPLCGEAYRATLNLLSEPPKGLTEIQLELSTLPVTELAYFGSTGLRSRPSHRLKEATIAGRDFVAFRNSGSVEKTLRSAESLLVERRNS